MESIHKSKAEKAREKTLSDQFEAKRAKNKASRERKIARREERLAQVNLALADWIFHTDVSLYSLLSYFLCSRSFWVTGCISKKNTKRLHSMCETWLRLICFYCHFLLLDWHWNHVHWHVKSNDAWQLTMLVLSSYSWVYEMADKFVNAIFFSLFMGDFANRWLCVGACGKSTTSICFSTNRVSNFIKQSFCICQ